MQREKIRVLQVTGGMNVGGAETWLMHVLRGIDRERFQFDFLVFSDEEQVYEAEILRLGGRIIRCSPPSVNPLFLQECFKAIRRNGPYDVIHCHVLHFSGVFLGLGKLAGISSRIAHSHSNSRLRNKSASAARLVYMRAMERAIRLFSTERVAVSDAAATGLFGDEWSNDSHSRILRAGIDLSGIESNQPDIGLRTSFGFQPDQWVVGHVARLHKAKNHEFLVDVATVLHERNENVGFLIIGDGELRPEIEGKVKSRGLERTFVLAGLRSDVQKLLVSAVNMFVLPSHYEGLPLSGLEAQAVGLPSLFSTNCSREAAVVNHLCEFLPIDDPIVWANRILEIRDSPPGVTKEDALAEMKASSFNIQRGIAELEQLYSGNTQNA